MYIHKAVKLAMEQNKFITIPGEKGNLWFKIKPTNDPEYNCALYGIDGQLPERDIHALSHGWQPDADDLISDRWELVD